MTLGLIVKEGVEEREPILLDDRVCYVSLDMGKQCTAVVLSDGKHAEITVDYKMIVKRAREKPAILYPAGEAFVMGPDDQAIQINPMLKLTLRYTDDSELIRWEK
tara:strand:+ start:1450 stop:1764 length:315 start_codon:yes stop_codon:yes gene_type:complete